MNKVAIEHFLFGRYGVALAWSPYVRDAVKEALAETAASYNAGLLKAAKICADLEVTQDMCLGARRAVAQACEERILAYIKYGPHRQQSTVTEPAAQVVSIPGKSAEQSMADQPCIAAATLVTFCPADGDPCRKMCDTVCKKTGQKTGKIPLFAPAAALDNRVTLTRGHLERLRPSLADDICNQALAAIDYKAEVERMRQQLADASVAAIANFAGKVNAEAALKPVSKEQIRGIAIDYNQGGPNYHLFESACRAVLQLAGVEVKP